MKYVLVAHIRQWYIIFAAGVLLAVAALSGVLQPIFDHTTSIAGKPQPIFQGNVANPQIAFACNVFWGEEFLPQMLNTLADNHVKITFFIGGSWAKRYPQILADIAGQGHELANHSYSHPHPNALDKGKNKEQIVKTEQLVQEITGVKTQLYAPPYGEYNDTVLMAADELGYKTIMWSIDTIDWQRPPADIIINRVMKKVHNGAIILIHPTANTAEALPQLIQRLQASGYQITSVSDILK